MSKIAVMDKLAKDFKEKGVISYTVYTREPHAGQKMPQYDFSDRKQTKTHEERIEYAEILVKDHGLKRPILIDTFAAENIQNTLGGGAPNSAIIIDEEGKVALWQPWSNADELRKKLEEMTGGKK